MHGFNDILKDIDFYMLKVIIPFYALVDREPFASMDFLPC